MPRTDDIPAGCHLVDGAFGPEVEPDDDYLDDEDTVTAGADGEPVDVAGPLPSDAELGLVLPPGVPVGDDGEPVNGGAS